MKHYVTALVLALASLSHAAYAGHVVPPDVPADIQVQEGFSPFLAGHAVGTQNYICAASATSPTGFGWLFIGPQATVFGTNSEQLLTHFLSENPLETTVPVAFRATWQHSRDTSAVWAKMYSSSSDADYVAPDAIDWLLLEVVGALEGPTGGEKLTQAAFIHRVNTVGGKAPATGSWFRTRLTTSSTRRTRTSNRRLLID